MAQRRARKLLYGRFYFQGKKNGERYYDTVAHRSISRYRFDKFKASYREREEIQREIREHGYKSTNPKARLQNYRQGWINQFWQNLSRGRIEGYRAESGPNGEILPKRAKRGRDEHSIRYSEIESSNLWKRIWRGLDPDRKDKSMGPNSPYAKSLELLGFRPREAWWNVGDTPKVQSGEEAGTQKWQVNPPTQAYAKQGVAYTTYGSMPGPDDTVRREERAWFAQAGPSVWYGRKIQTRGGQVYYQPSLFGQAQFLRQ